LFQEPQNKQSYPGKGRGPSVLKKKWKPPAQGWVKLNTDAGFCPNPSVASIGVVARDSGGKVVLMVWRLLRHCGSP
jgi:hypothetical protein